MNPWVVCARLEFNKILILKNDSSIEEVQTFYPHRNW